MSASLHCVWRETPLHPFAGRSQFLVTMSDGYTSNELQAVRKALLACNDADRAYLRRWILRWVDEALKRFTRRIASTTAPQHRSPIGKASHANLAPGSLRG